MLMHVHCTKTHLLCLPSDTNIFTMWNSKSNKNLITVIHKFKTHKFYEQKSYVGTEEFPAVPPSRNLSQKAREAAEGVPEGLSPLEL